MHIYCANCRAKYRVDEAKLAAIRARQPACKVCGEPVFRDDVDPAVPPGGDSGNTRVFDEATAAAAREAKSLPARFGNFRVDGLLGRGGMGSVYKGWDEALARPVAIKVLSEQLYANQDTRSRFLVEARALARLTHPNITQVFSAGQDGEQPWFAMEYVDGPSVQGLIKDNERIDAGEAVRIVRAVVEGLRHAQKAEIIHRDIKPGNILIAPDGTPKVTDFGLAKLIKEDHGLTTTGMVMGTPSYIAPEQAKGEPVDFRADIYSLGATFYEMVMGTPPFVADSTVTVLMKHINEPVRFPVQAVTAAVPPPVTGVIRKMMAKHPDGRHLSYDALAQDLDQLAARLAAPAESDPDKPASARRAPPARPVYREPEAPGWGRRLLLAGALLVVIGAGWRLTRSPGPAEPAEPVVASRPAAPVPPPAILHPASTEHLAEPAVLAPRKRGADVKVAQSLLELLPDEKVRVFGTLRNQETGPVRNLVVEISLYTDTDLLIAEASGPTEPPVVLPGETARFSVVFGRVSDVHHYTVRGWADVK